MKFKHLFLAAFAAVAMVFTSCNKEEDLGAANVSVETATITLESGEASETITFTATRDWTLTCPDWIAPSANNGKASSSKQTVTISIEENKGNDRSGDVVISIGLAKATVTVTQKGALGKYEAEEGDGSKDKPFNVAQALDAVKNLTWTDKDNYEKVGPYYVRGKVVSIKDAFSAEYGNGTFTISDDGSADGAQFTCYRVYYLENKKWVEGNTQIQVGDVAVIYGELMYYGTGADGKSRVAETVQKGSYLYSLNGETKPTGGVEVDYNNAPAKSVAEFISAADATNYYKLTGKVSKFNATYCSFDLTDDSGSIYVYSVLNKDDWASKIANDATVVLAGKYKLYKKADGTEQHEVVDAYILSCEGGSPAIDPNTAPDITVADLIAKNDEENYYKLTGTVSKFNKTYCSFDLTDATGTIYVYSVANKADWVDKIADGATVVLAGQYQLYKKEGKEDQPEIINAIIISCEGGTQQQDSEPKGSGTLADPYNAAKAKEVALALEAGSKTETDVYVSGKISSIKYTFSAKYGTATFNISEDGTTSSTEFQIYGVYYLGNRAWVEGDANVAVGDEVIICGKLMNYSGTPETSNKEAYIYSLNGQTDIAQSDVFGVASTTVSVSGSATSATVKVTGNVAWTAESADATVTPEAGQGAGDITVTFEANTDTENEKTYTVVVSTTADVATKSFTVTITQAKALGDDMHYLKVETNNSLSWTSVSDDTYKEGRSVTVEGVTITAYKNTSNTNFDNFSQEGHIRIFKNYVLKIDAGAEIVKVVLNCAFNDKCFEITAVDGSKGVADTTAKTVTWEGSLNPFIAEMTGGQNRVASIEVYYH